MLKTIVSIFGSLMLIFFIFIISLYSGINIEHYKNETIDIKSLYIKYDKNLILSIKELKVIPSKDDTKTKIDLSSLRYFNDILNHIQEINIDKIIYEKEILSFNYKNNQIKFQNKEGIAKLDLEYKNNILYGNLKFLLNNFDLSIDADILLDIQTDILKYNIKSNQIRDIGFIKRYKKLNPDIEKLLYSQIMFNFLELKNLNGKIDINSIDQFDLNSINGKFCIDKFVINYEKYPEVLLKNIVINLDNGKLNINIKKDKKNNILSMDSNIFTTLEFKNIDSNSSIYYKDLNIKADINISNDLLKYKLLTNRFKDIKIFEEFVSIPPSIKKWAIDRLDAKSTKINNISGNIYLKDFFVDLKSLRVDASLDDIVMDFNPKRAFPLEAQQVNLYFDGKDMNIKLKKPISNDVDLDQSDAVIYDMFGESGLLLRLQTISPLNWTLVRSVKSYDVNIADQLGIRQTKGKSDIKVKIDIPFGDNPVDVYVKIINKNSTLKIKDNYIDFNKFHFIYKDNSVIMKNSEALYQNYGVDIKDLLFDIKKNNLSLDLDTYDKSNTFDISIKNNTNLDINHTYGKIDIKYIDLNNTIKVRNKTIPYDLKFGDKIDIDYPYFGLKYNKNFDSHKLQISKIERLNEFIIPLRDISLDKSSLSIITNDLRNIDINLSLIKNIDINSSFDIDILSKVDLDKNNTNIDMKLNKLKLSDTIELNSTTIPLFIDFKNTDNIVFNTSFDTKDYNITYKNEKLNQIDLDGTIKDKNFISIKDKNIFSVDIDINDTLKVDLELNDFGINYIETVDKKDTNKTTKPKPKSICEVIPLDLPFIDAKLNGGYFNYNNHIVNYDNIKIDTNNTNLKFLLDYNNTNLTLDLSEDINLTIDSIQYSYINSLAGSNIIDNGSIEVYLEGTQCLFDSNIYLKDVEIKDAKILNKIFLIINSAPAAINPFLILPNAYRFAKDNFSLKSYKITNGDIALNINRETNIVDIKKLNAKGVHSDFYLKGKIDLYENNISSKMDVVFMKDYAAIINYIPLVRYVLLGDDKMFSYSVDINGDISNPKVSTHIMKETLLAPINIIKRILISPLLPFRDINMTDEQKQHHQQIVDEFIN